MHRGIRERLQGLWERLETSPLRRGLFLATTGNRSNPPLHFSSIREGGGVLAGSLVFRDTSAVEEVVDFFDGKLDFFFLDTEVKNEVRDLEKKVRHAVRSTPIVPFKPNDLTVLALDLFLSWKVNDLRGKNVAVVGAGNIGSKAALVLAEKGAHVTLLGRDADKTTIIVAGLNAFVRGHGRIEAGGALDVVLPYAGVVIGCTPGVPVIDAAHAGLLSHNALVVDVGSGFFDEEAAEAFHAQGKTVYCLSSEAGMRAFLEGFRFGRETFPTLGRKKSSRGPFLITPGILGRRGDVLVDDLDDPRKIYGVCDGKGDVLPPEQAAPFLEGMKDD